MKRIAIFVEGQTEQFFINKLLIEVAGYKNIAISLRRFQGKNRRPTEEIWPKTQARSVNPEPMALIYDCGGDESVKSRILEEHQGLFSQGYLEIIGIRDLYPLRLEELPILERRLQDGFMLQGNRVGTLPPHTHIVVAVHEIEAWFLSECNHFSCIDTGLTKSLLESATSDLGFNPYTQDMTLRFQPSQDLKTIYQLVGKTYSKKKEHIEGTVECLDYANLYLNLTTRIEKLNELIAKIDDFLS